MTTSEQCLLALQGLQRARVALDVLWRECRQTAPTTAQLDSMVFDVAVELSGVYDSLESVVESTLRAMISGVDRLTPTGGRKDA